MIPILAAIAACLSLVIAHGSHSQEALVDPAEDWALYHLQEEHHISNFDAPSFFSLHDFNNDGAWTPDEVRRIYGLDDESLKSTPAETKDRVVLDVFKIFDPTGTGLITRTAWVDACRAGQKLPDSKLGPGHHGDDEYEYEIHHFEKFHDENTQVEDLIHPEDIEHFRKHEMREDLEARVEMEQQQRIVERNIPPMFRKQQK